MAQHPQSQPPPLPQQQEQEQQNQRNVPIGPALVHAPSSSSSSSSLAVERVPSPPTHLHPMVVMTQPQQQHEQEEQPPPPPSPPPQVCRRSFPCLYQWSPFYEQTVFTALDSSHSVFDWNNLATLAMQRGYYDRAAQMLTLTLSRLCHQGLQQQQQQQLHQQLQPNPAMPVHATNVPVIPVSPVVQKEDPLDLVVEAAATATGGLRAPQVQAQHHHHHHYQAPAHFGDQVMVTEVVVEGMQTVQQREQDMEEEEERTVYSDPDLRSLTQEELDEFWEQDMMEADALEGVPDGSYDFNDEVTLYSAPTNMALMAPSSFQTRHNNLSSSMFFPQFQRFELYDQSFGTVRNDPEQAQTSTGLPLTIAMVRYNLAVCLHSQQFFSRSPYYRHYQQQIAERRGQQGLMGQGRRRIGNNEPPDTRILQMAHRFYLEALDAVTQYEQAEQVAIQRAHEQAQLRDAQDNMGEDQDQEERRLPRMTEDILHLKLAIYNNLGHLHDEWNQWTESLKCFQAMKALLMERTEVQRHWQVYVAAANLLHQGRPLHPPHIPLWTMNPSDYNFFGRAIQAMDAQEKGQGCSFSPAA